MERHAFCDHQISFKRGGFESRESAEKAAIDLIINVEHPGSANYSKTKDGVECVITLSCNTSNPNRCLIRKLKSLKSVKYTPETNHNCLHKEE